jgi:uncharacterized protein (TIGR02266 family)
MTDVQTPPRRHRRVPVRLPVRLISIDPETDSGSGRTCFRASRELCANVSDGGAYIRTDEPLAPGRRLLLELQLPGGCRFETMGRVAWSRTVLTPGGTVESGAGVEFIGVSQEQRAPLREVLEGATH